MPGALFGTLGCQPGYIFTSHHSYGLKRDGRDRNESIERGLCNNCCGRIKNSSLCGAELSRVMPKEGEGGGLGGTQGEEKTTALLSMHSPLKGKMSCM